MSYHVAYGFEDSEPVDGPHLASGAGWSNWSDWVLTLVGYEECHALAVNGWSEPEGGLNELSRELAALATEEDADEDLLDITKTLREAVRDRPRGAASIIVTDGTEPGDGGEDYGEEE
jgi:hypothetical protein